MFLRKSAYFCIRKKMMQIWSHTPYDFCIVKDCIFICFSVICGLGRDWSSRGTSLMSDGLSTGLWLVLTGPNRYRKHIISHMYNIHNYILYWFKQVFLTNPYLLPLVSIKIKYYCTCIYYIFSTFWIGKIDAHWFQEIKWHSTFTVVSLICYLWCLHLILTQ